MTLQNSSNPLELFLSRRLHGDVKEDNFIATVGSLCIMGSMPPGWHPDLHAVLYDMVFGTNTTGTISDDLFYLVYSVVRIDHLLESMARNHHWGGANEEEEDDHPSPMC